MFKNNLMKSLEQQLLGINIIRFVNGERTGFIERQQFGVSFDPDKWTRSSCADLELEIEEVWQTKLQKSKLYNGKKFRFGGINLYNNEVTIHLGITCYKDIIGISQSKNVDKWMLRGHEETGNLQAYMSDGLGVGILAFSRDGHLILIRRAEWTGEYPGMIDRPGGHPEPDNVLENNKTVSNNRNALQDMVAKEVWNSPLQELEAEIGVSVDHVKNHTLLGIVRNTFLAGRPSLEFSASLDCTADEVLQIYDQKKHSEVDESTALHLINPQQLKLIINNIKAGNVEESQSATSGSSHMLDIQNFTPALKGALFLWSLANFPN